MHRYTFLKSERPAESKVDVQQIIIEWMNDPIN